MTDDRYLSPRVDGDDHPSTFELSESVDGLRTPDEMAAIDTHVESCSACATELGLLRSGRAALAGSGQPIPPPTAVDSAVAAAMASVAGVARDGAQSAAAPIAETTGASALALPETLTPVADLPSPRPAGERSPNAEQPSADGPPTSSVTPLSGRSEESRRRSMLRQRRLRIATRAAVVVLLLGALSGAGYAVARSYEGESAMSSSGTTAPLNALSTGRTNSSTTQPIHPVQPPAGAFALQLRPQGRPEPCSMVGHHVARLNGSVIPVNPPADHAAIVSLASVAGRPTACVAVGLVFATIWSGDVSKVTVGPSGAGGKVDATIALAADAVSNQLRFDAGVAGHFMVAVIVRGSEFGTAVLKTGQIVVLSVAKSFATYIAQHLGTHRS